MRGSFSFGCFCCSVFHLSLHGFSQPHDRFPGLQFPYLVTAGYHSRSGCGHGGLLQQQWHLCSLWRRLPCALALEMGWISRWLAKDCWYCHDMLWSLVSLLLFSLVWDLLLCDFASFQTCGHARFVPGDAVGSFWDTIYISKFGWQARYIERNVPTFSWP